MNKLFGILCVATMSIASTANAGAYTAKAAPTSVEIVNGGLLIEGAFGDPNGCGVGGYIFVNQSSTTFKEVVAMAYTALASGRKLQFYAASCTSVSFHWAGSVINLLSDGHAASMY